MNLILGPEVVTVLALLMFLVGGSAIYFIRVNAKMEKKLAELNAELEKYRELSLIDELTGINNRRAFEDSVDKALATLDRYNHPPQKSTLASIDLDKFKLINDTLGHDAGDEALIIIADVLINTIRTTDVVGRIGGDEFNVLFLNATKSQACAILERVRLEYERRIDDLFKRNDRTRPEEVSLSFGLAERGRQEQGREYLAQKADVRLYEAKRA